MRKSGFFYFLTNKTNEVLYCGVTSDLARRTAEHITKVNSGFAERYNCNKLVYFEEFPTITKAINREKQIKNWKREWKNRLINEQNPNWDDLSLSVGVDGELLEAVRRMYGE
ncbi:MAG: GIY-YIG nuclease family protein [Chitinophagaceae bacterium]|nr:GIY-YIG nuclease family protein [Chitinophagaceae bacterium]